MEAIRDENHLLQLCKKKYAIAEDLRLCLAESSAFSNGVTGREYRIAGKYGIQMFKYFNDAPLPIAQAGISLIDEAILVTNSPQGYSKGKMEALGYTDSQIKFALNELRVSSFRKVLMGGIILVAQRCKDMGIKRIIGKSAYTNEKVDLGLLTIERAKLSMDELYAKFGFQPVNDVNIRDGDFVLTLI